MSMIYKNTLYEKPVIWPKYNEKSVNHITLNGIEVYNLGSAKISGGGWFSSGGSYASVSILKGNTFGKKNSATLQLLRDVPKLKFYGNLYLNPDIGSNYGYCVLRYNGTNVNTISGCTSGDRVVSYTRTDCKKGDYISYYMDVGWIDTRIYIGVNITITAEF